LKLGFDEQLAQEAVFLHRGDSKAAISYALTEKKNR
jgi:hypothetical protein